jgi:hypothetical protein
MPATLDRKFEKFLGGPTQPLELRVRVSLGKRNVILMNRKCYQMLGKPTAVYLHFSRADDIIAIEPVHSYRLPAAFPVRVYDTTFSINAAPFCRHFGIKLDATQQFISPEIRDGALQLKLSETITITRKRRMKKKQV